MTLRTLFCLVTRLLYAALALTSALWCLLAWIPFTWQQVIKGHLLPPLSAFAASAHWINLGVVTALAAQLLLTNSRLSVRIFLSVQTLLALFCLASPVVANVQNNVGSLLWAATFLTLLSWLGILDADAARRRLTWSPRQARVDARAFYAAWRAALFVALTYSLLPLLNRASTSAVFDPALLAWATASHFVLFSLVFIAAGITAALASFFARPARFEFLLGHLFLCVTLFFFISGTVFPAISFQGVLATLAAAVLSLSVTLFCLGVSATVGAAPGFVVSAGFDLLISPLTALLGRGTAAHLVILPLLALAFARLSIAASGFDWNYLGQEILAVAFWALAFALFYSLSGLRAPRLRRTLPAVMAATGICVAHAGAASRWAPDQLLQAYAGRNVSYRLIRSIVAPPAEDSAFYAFLNASSNIARSVPVAPVNIELAGKLTATPGLKPNIFVIVIDSLRRDYLGAYNPSVTFTPALDAFARENAAFPNAFTRYGGTGLAEPSIWLGGITLHKQYITPFHPMNSLAKLVNAEGYHQLISMDTILDTVVPRSPQLTELDHDRLTMDYDLCHTLTELQQALPNTARPVFAYTQPQNIHISAIAREGKSVPPGETYPGFYAPYASRLRRLDACFGNFISYLKSSGLYSSSVVVLTSDHGDSLGEEGRWGHAYTLFPEILRIPLLIHLPNARTFGQLPNSAVFSTDVTPTLYHLLGHEPTTTSGIFGRSLFAAPAPHPDYMVAASYAAVYGLVNRDGTRLFISDAVSARDYLYSIPTSASASELPLSPEENAASKKRLHTLIGELNAFYSFRPATP